MRSDLTFGWEGGNAEYVVRKRGYVARLRYDPGHGVHRKEIFYECRPSGKPHEHSTPHFVDGAFRRWTDNPGLRRRHYHGTSTVTGSDAHARAHSHTCRNTDINHYIGFNTGTPTILAHRRLADLYA